MPDYNFLMESRLIPAQSRVVNQLGRLAANHGLNLYLAGGAVRDLTLGLDRPRDLNFVLAGNVNKLARLLASHSGRHPPARPAGAPGAPEPIDLAVSSMKVDARRGVAELVFADGIRADISSAHNEVFKSPGRPPQISPASIFDDLRRRDFSANAMAVSLHPNSRGLLLDPTNGAADLERREIRALHSRIFFDDPSRVYRLLRLGIRLDLKPDERTTRWIETAFENRVWETMRPEQQARELRAVLEEDLCGRVIKAFKDRNILSGLDRKLAAARIDFDKFERTRAALRLAGGNDAAAMNFLGVTARLSDAERARLAPKMLGDARTVKFALSLPREAAKLAKPLQSAKAARLSYVYQLLAPAPRAVPVYLMVHYPQAAVQSRVKSFFTKVPAIRAQLPRAELEALGAPPGPKFEQVLARIFLDQLDGRVRTPQQITKVLREYAGIKPPPKPPKPPAPRPTAAPPSRAAEAAGKTPAPPKPGAEAAAGKAAAVKGTPPAGKKPAAKPRVAARQGKSAKAISARPRPKPAGGARAAKPAASARKAPRKVSRPAAKPAAKQKETKGKKSAKHAKRR